MPSLTVRPIARLTTQVRDDSHDQGFPRGLVNQAVREPGQQTSAQARFDLGTGFRVRDDARERPVHFIEEFLPQPNGLIVVPISRVFKLSAGEGK